jgi:hypothetical protein
MRIRTTAIIVAAAAFVLPATASASEIIDRNASKVTIKVAADGQALVSYNARGKRWNVLAWGGVNAIPATPSRKQVEFKLDYSGGYGTYKRDVWKTLKDVCSAYDGPKLQWFVTGCKAPDGSYWALQAWQRMLPNYGLVATPKQSVWELRLSHWSGPVAELTVNLNWAYKKYHHIFGSFTYLGKPVYGMKSTPSGVPLDTFGRNLYLDTFNSAYSKGWMRENSFLMHKNTGMFCYGFYPHGARPEGDGTKYRATIIGPGVTPDIYWSSDALGAYDKDFDLQQHAMQKDFFVGDALCHAV